MEDLRFRGCERGQEIEYRIQDTGYWLQDYIKGVILQMMKNFLYLGINHYKNGESYYQGFSNK